MTDILLRIRENNRRIVRGCTHDDSIGRTRIQCSTGETVKADVDLEDWLGTATITAVSISPSGGAVSYVQNGDTITLTATNVDGQSVVPGDCDVTITCSDGRIRVERFRFEMPNADYYRDRWNYCGDC